MEIDIFFEDTQDKLDVDENIQQLVENVVCATLEYEQFDKNVEISVLFVDDDQIRDINEDFRQIDKPTDVLSFPMLSFDGKKMIDDVGDTYLGTVVLGDIVISLERAHKQAIEYGHSLQREIGFLVCHSVLHLLGYDHESDEQRTEMRQKEEAVLINLSLTR